LKELSDAATPGAWEWDEYDPRRVNCADRGEMILATGLNGQHEAEATYNAAFVAALVAAYRGGFLREEKA
jgi:hypothetical protein